MKIFMETLIFSKVVWMITLCRCQNDESEATEHSVTESQQLN